MCLKRQKYRTLRPDDWQPAPPGSLDQISFRVSWILLTTLWLEYLPLSSQCDYTYKRSMKPQAVMDLAPLRKCFPSATGPIITSIRQRLSWTWDQTRSTFGVTYPEVII